MIESVTLNWIKNTISGEFISVGLASFDGRLVRLATNLNKIEHIIDDFEKWKPEILVLMRSFKREFDFSKKTLSKDLPNFKAKKDKPTLQFGSIFVGDNINAEEDFNNLARNVLGHEYKRIDLYSSRDFIICECVPWSREDDFIWTSHHKECKHYNFENDLKEIIKYLVDDFELAALKNHFEPSDYVAYQKAKFVLTGLFPKLKDE